jgi:hypothetical protein
MDIRLFFYLITGVKFLQFVFANIGVTPRLKVNFFLGAIMTAGVGLYAPCMALIFALGMSPKVAFPIMMGSCAFLCLPLQLSLSKRDLTTEKLP